MKRLALVSTIIALNALPAHAADALKLDCTFSSGSSVSVSSISKENASTDKYGTTRVSGAAINDDDYPVANLTFNRAQKPALVIRPTSASASAVYYDIDVDLCSAANPETGAATTQGNALIPGGGDAGPTEGHCSVSDIRRFNDAFGIYCGPWAVETNVLLVPFEHRDQPTEMTYVVHQDGAKYVQLQLDFVTTDYGSEISVESVAGERLGFVGPDNRLSGSTSSYVKGDTILVKAKGTGWGFGLTHVNVAR